MNNDKLREAHCPVCGYYCLGKGGYGCIDKPASLAASKPELQAQAAEPKPVQFHDHPDFVGGVKWSELELKWIEARDKQWREAIAQRGAALDACAEALKYAQFYSNKQHVIEKMNAAITKAQEARKS